MQAHHMVLFYVQDAARSAAFYKWILESEPIDSSPTFAMFKVNDQMILGLWNRDGVQPPPAAEAGASEIGFHVTDRDSVSETYRRWSGGDVAIAQAPTDMDFGYTFTALDPDGHRLRVFATPR